MLACSRVFIPEASSSGFSRYFIIFSYDPVNPSAFVSKVV